MTGAADALVRPPRDSAAGSRMMGGVSDGNDTPEVDEKILAMTPGERIELCFQLTWDWWEIHDPEALHAGFRRDVARVIRLRDYES